MNDNVAYTLPWKHPDLVDWSIVGMNHYYVNGNRRRIFIAIVRDNYCVKVEGQDISATWEELRLKAQRINRALIQPSV